MKKSGSPLTKNFLKNSGNISRNLLGRRFFEKFRKLPSQKVPGKSWSLGFLSFFNNIVTTSTKPVSCDICRSSNTQEKGEVEHRNCRLRLLL